jgi:hypothetical protein
MSFREEAISHQLKVNEGNGSVTIHECLSVWLMGTPNVIGAGCRFIKIFMRMIVFDN